MKPMLRRKSTVLLALCLTGAVACAREAPEAGAQAMAAAPAASGGTVLPAVVSTAGSTPSSTTAKAGERMVISEVRPALRSEDPARAAERASGVASRTGGYVLSRDAVSAEESVVRVDMVLRVPAEKLESSLVELRQTGKVLDEARTGHDVTEEFSDATAELGAKHKIEERLLQILGAAKSVKEMLEVEGELGRIRTEIDKLEGHTRYLQNSAALATITLSIASPAQPVVPIAESLASRLGNAFSDSCSLCFQVTTGIIIALGAASPLLVPALVAFFLVRRHRRMARKALVSA
jgi:hypothetical protein